MNMIKIAPSILTANFLYLGDEIKAIEQAGADYIHLDVMDGNFVPNISFGPLVISHIKKISSLPLDIHLMIVHPEKYIDMFAQAGASMITVHQETCPHLHRTIQQIKDTGCKAGVAINPSTPISMLEDILPNINLVLIMSVNPGFGGQQFIPSTIQKIKKIKTITQQLNPLIEIEIDGGINATNIHSVWQAGANVVVAGSSVFNHNSIKTNIIQMRKALE